MRQRMVGDDAAQGGTGVPQARSGGAATQRHRRRDRLSPRRVRAAHDDCVEYAGHEPHDRVLHRSGRDLRGRRCLQNLRFPRHIQRVMLHDSTICRISFSEE